MEMQKKWKREEDRTRKAFRRKSEGGSIVRDYNSLKKYRNRVLKIDSNGYWNFGDCIECCEYCNALHFMGENLSGSSFKRLKFENCCSNGQLSPHFELGIHCRQSNYIFLTKDREPSHAPPLENAHRANLKLRKFFQHF